MIMEPRSELNRQIPHVLGSNNLGRLFRKIQPRIITIPSVKLQA